MIKFFKEIIMDDSIRDIITSAQAGSECAFNDLYHHYYNYVYYYALKLCKNEYDANEVTQETFFEVNRSLPSLQHIEYFNIWLSRITFSKCTALFRKKKVTYFENLSFSTEEEKNKDYIPHEYLNQENEKLIIKGLIGMLTEKQQEILNLLYFQQLSYQEIADKLDIPMGTAKSRCNLAKKELKKRIDDFEKIEGRKLDFNIGNISGFISITSMIPWIKQHFAAASKQQIIKMSTAVIFTGVSVTAGVDTYQSVMHYKSIKAEEQKQVELTKELPKRMAPIQKQQFPHVAFKEKRIDNATDAYYELLGLLDSSSSINELSEEDKQQVKSLYTTLMDTDNGFKEYLQKQYAEYFESL